MTDLIEKGNEIIRKRDRIRARIDAGLPPLETIEQGRAEEAEQDVVPRVESFGVIGWRTNDEAEVGERHTTPYPNIAASMIWGMLRRGFAQILVEGLASDGTVCYREGGTP